MLENEFGVCKENLRGIFKELEVAMNTNTDLDKIDKVLSKITGKELKSFVRLFSYTHDDFACLLGEVRHVMGHSHIADEVIKDGIKKMIAEYLDKYYVKNY